MDMTAERPYIICIAGGTASGKTTLARMLLEQLGEDVCAVLPMDCYYYDNGHLSLAEKALVNYDHPEAFEFSLIRQQLEELRQGREVSVPQYDFSTHSRTQTVGYSPKQILIFEGILGLVDESLRPLFDYSIFVKAADDLRFQRRLERDVRERGRSPESVRSQWESTVQPMHDQFCGPTESYADRVVHGVGDFSTIVESIIVDVRESQKQHS